MTEKFIYFPRGYSKPPRIVREKPGMKRTSYQGTPVHPSCDLVPIAAANRNGHEIINSLQLQPYSDAHWRAIEAARARFEAARDEYRATIDRLREGWTE